jgi:hypothetical protein
MYWYLAPVMYLGLAVEYLLNPFSQSKNLDIHWSVFLGCILTMVFTSILNIILVSRSDRVGSDFRCTEPSYDQLDAEKDCLQGNGQNEHDLSTGAQAERH